MNTQYNRPQPPKPSFGAGILLGIFGVLVVVVFILVALGLSTAYRIREAARQRQIEFGPKITIDGKTHPYNPDDPEDRSLMDAMDGLSTPTSITIGPTRSVAPTKPKPKPVPKPVPPAPTFELKIQSRLPGSDKLVNIPPRELKVSAPNETFADELRASQAPGSPLVLVAFDRADKNGPVESGSVWDGGPAYSMNKVPDGATFFGSQFLWLLHPKLLKPASYFATYSEYGLEHYRLTTRYKGIYYRRGWIAATEKPKLPNVHKLRLYKTVAAANGLPVVPITLPAVYLPPPSNRDHYVNNHSDPYDDFDFTPDRFFKRNRVTIDDHVWEKW